MGSALLSMVRMMTPKKDGAPPVFVQDLHREDQTLQERSVCGCGSQSLPHHGTTATPCRLRTEEERDASITCHVHHALRHYNASNPGSEFVLVKPLMAAYVGFQSHIWVHVGFVARRKKIASSKRRRNQANEADKTFFAELRYSHHLSGAPAVETCAIIEKSSRKSHLKTACAFCPESFQILHPLDGSFLCGKKSQTNEGQGFTHFTNLLELPFTCPTANGEGKEDAAAPQEEEHSSTLSWAALPFHFIGNLITRVLPALIRC
ncbi:hypothetical protein VPH35_091184 [Triticum aestivum]|uniref:uncharacterized protein n=1 Tax=Triticum aestivum TaxID=4565 RepID=UPI000843A60E|nr:uncharacterized protein LOC123116502 [Triticum aestivum]